MIRNVIGEEEIEYAIRCTINSAGNKKERVCMYLRERGGERKGQTDRQTERQTDKQFDTQTALNNKYSQTNTHLNNYKLKE